MDLEQLKAFLSVAETKNFTRTAELLHVTQSTITTRIKNLEQALGKPLFVRNNRRVELTHFAETILPYVKKSITMIEECKTMARLGELFEARLAIGSTHWLWEGFMWNLIPSFQCQFPHIALKLVSGHSSEIIQAVLEGVLDIGYVAIPPQSPEIELISVTSNSYRLVASSALPIDFPEPLPAKEWLSLPFVFMDWGPSFSSWFHREMNSPAIPGIEVDQTHLLMKWIQDHQRIGFVLSSIADPKLKSGELQEIRFTSRHPIPKQMIYAIHLKRKAYEPKIQAWREIMDQSRKESGPI